MPPLPRLIATDLDGTLLNHERALSPRTVTAVAAAVAAGVEFVLVTARPPRTVAPLARRLGGRITALCANGALLAEFGTDEFHSAASGPTELEPGGPQWRSTLIQSFETAQALEIVRQLRPALPEAGFALETGHEVYHEPEYGVGSVVDDRRILVPDLAAARTARPFVKVLVRSPRRSPDELVEMAGRTLSVPAEATHAGGPGLMEIAPPGTSKASGLAWLCAGRGIDAADVIAFGDMPNDLPMLRWAGIGHAVANAHPDVLAAADQVVGHHAEDGVAAALEELFAGLEAV